MDFRSGGKGGACRHRHPYQFGFKITDFHACPRCGVAVCATWQDNGQAYAVFNIHALGGAMLFTGAPRETDFTGEDIAARSERRRTGWTPITIK